MLHGSCLCHAVTVTIDADAGPITACHCTQCRKSSGFYTASFDADPGTVTFTGPIARYTRPAGATWMFCPTCGTKIGFLNPAGELSIEAGLIDGPTHSHLAEHTFVAFKGDYYTLDDGIPQFAERGNV